MGLFQRFVVRIKFDIYVFIKIKFFDHFDLVQFPFL
jgi:hypothetical protein